MFSLNENQASTEVVAVDGCLSTTIDDESVVLHVEQGKYYGFNEIGTQVWKRIQQPRTVDRIRQDIVAAYDVEGERCLDDVTELLDELIEKGLVRATD